MQIWDIFFEKIQPIFHDLGFEINDFRIEGTSFDTETQERIGKISNIAADVYAAKMAGVEFSELQKLQALRDSAKNEGGAAGLGAGMAAGMAMGSMMNTTQQTNTLPTSADVNDPAVQLEKLKNLFEKNLITEEEYKIKKKDILNKM